MFASEIRSFALAPERLTTRIKPVVAIEIGSTKIACVVGQSRSQPFSALDGRTSARPWDLLGAGVAPYAEPSASYPCEPALIAQALEQALAQARLTQPIDRAVVCLSHPHLVHKRLTVQIELAQEPVTVQRRHLARLRAQALGQALGLDQEALACDAIDYAGNGFSGVRQPQGLMTMRLAGTFHVVAMPIALRRAVLAALEQAGLDVDRFLYSLQALAAALIQTTSPAGGSRLMVIDLGGCSIDLGLVERGRLIHAQTLPWGGMAVVEAIAGKGGVSRQAASALAAKGTSQSDPQIELLLDEYLAKLEKALAQFLHGHARPELCVVVGRGALMDGLLERLEGSLGMKTVLGRSRLTASLGDLSTQLQLGAAAGAVELACQGTQPPSRSQPTNLIERVLQRAQFLLTEYF